MMKLRFILDKQHYSKTLSRTGGDYFLRIGSD